ncbi:hypothetical protein TNCV_2642721 [Trichonephila clavipes]|nr:hypothetical protein TNCV_2642721 [Trichonephila clavipes]
MTLEKKPPETAPRKLTSSRDKWSSLQKNNSPERTDGTSRQQLFSDYLVDHDTDERHKTVIIFHSFQKNKKNKRNGPTTEQKGDH